MTDQEQQRERRHQVNNVAAEYFLQSMATPAAATAHDRLQAMGISPRVARTFRLGFADPDWESLLRHLEQNDIAVAEAEEAWLVRKEPGRQSYYDSFRDHLMCPVTDEHGAVVGFHGRALGEADPGRTKYLNTPDNGVYTKGEAVFALVQARDAIRERGRVVLVEGLLDVPVMHQAGIRETVALNGICTTQEQALILKRHANLVVILFDGDKFGRKSAREAVRVLEQDGMSVRVVNLPPGDAPQTFLQNRGVEAMCSLLEWAG